MCALLALEHDYPYIDVARHKMPAYVARPCGTGRRPAIVVLEGLYGFDDEVRRVTDLVASVGYVGVAINYFYRLDPHFCEPFTPSGQACGIGATKSIRVHELQADLEATRDWLRSLPYVDPARIGAWGFGFGGAAAFTAACVPGYQVVAAFYPQSIGKRLPSGDPPPIDGAKSLRAPMLLFFGGRDDQIKRDEIVELSRKLKDASKKFDVHLYDTVGHSFFRDQSHSYEIADAWERVQAFFRMNL
ncbi:MAG: dienelactone hydrolase family protein [Polyangiaceae bacterium]